MQKKTKRERVTSSAIRKLEEQYWKKKHIHFPTLLIYNLLKNLLFLVKEKIIIIIHREKKQRDKKWVYKWLLCQLVYLSLSLSLSLVWPFSSLLIFEVLLFEYHFLILPIVVWNWRVFGSRGIYRKYLEMRIHLYTESDR